MTFLRGFEATMIDLALGNEQIFYVRDRAAEIVLEQIGLIARADPDRVFLLMIGEPSSRCI